jgi:hypothetical protein
MPALDPHSVVSTIHHSRRWHSSWSGPSRHLVAHTPPPHVATDP